MATFMRYHETPRIMSVHQVCSRDANKTLESDGPNKGGKSKYVEHKKLMREKKRKGEGKKRRPIEGCKPMDIFFKEKKVTERAIKKEVRNKKERKKRTVHN